jgi:predicted alpha/beta-fold hydrolase
VRTPGIWKLETRHYRARGSAGRYTCEALAVSCWISFHISSSLCHVPRSQKLGFAQLDLIRILASLRTLADNNREEIEKFSDVDINEISKVQYLYEFDRAYQCPTWGYPTEDAYYRDASSVDSLLGVRIPLLALNSEDDPISVKMGLPYLEAKKNPYTVLCTTSLGGHIGWFEIGGGRWHGKPVSTINCPTGRKLLIDSLYIGHQLSQPHGLRDRS